MSNDFTLGKVERDNPSNHVVKNGEESRDVIVGAEASASASDLEDDEEEISSFDTFDDDSKDDSDSDSSDDDISYSSQSSSNDSEDSSSSDSSSTSSGDYSYSSIEEEEENINNKTSITTRLPFRNAAARMKNRFSAMTGGGIRTPGTITRRRNQHTSDTAHARDILLSPSTSTTESTDHNGKVKKRSHQNPIYRRHPRQNEYTLYNTYNQAFYQYLTKRSTTILFLSIFIWFYSQMQYSPPTTTTHNNNMKNMVDIQREIGNDPKRLKEYTEKLKKERTTSAFQALGNAAGSFFHRGGGKNNKHKKNGNGKKEAEKDKLPRGCSETSWQKLSFPTCNDIHEIDLLAGTLGGLTGKGGKIIPADLGYGDKSNIEDVARTNSDGGGGNRTNTYMENKKMAGKMGYVGSGLWRQVWKVNPRDEQTNTNTGSNININPPAVLKIMKQEHPVDIRNFDRHRRDALVMERLTSSENIVSIYGFCGNTVLTEYAGMTLDDLLYHSENAPPVSSKSTSSEKQQQIELLHKTPEGRIHLATEVMRGLNALHTGITSDDGKSEAILHADIQAKQFLYDPVHKKVKLNDFNRCRFIPRDDNTGELCMLRIHSAPGGNRSPEEYEQKKLDEKIDIFSVANVLFGILTRGEAKPWDITKRVDIQKKIKKGQTPEIKDKYRKSSNMDDELATIIMNAYSFKPEDRRSASQILNDLAALGNNEDRVHGPGDSVVVRGNNSKHEMRRTLHSHERQDLQTSTEEEEINEKPLPQLRRRKLR